MIAAYLRVSTEKQNPDNQKEEILRYAKSRRISVDLWVTETVSGKKNEKERKLGSLLRRLKPGDTLIVTEISRLSRTLTDIMEIMGKCLKKKIRLYTTKEGYSFDDSINSKVLCFAQTVCSWAGGKAAALNSESCRTIILKYFQCLRKGIR